VDLLDVMRVELRAIRLLQSVSSAESLARDLGAVLKDMPTVDAGGIYLLDGEGGALQLMTHWGLTPEFIRATSRVTLDSHRGRIVRAGVPVRTGPGTGVLDADAEACSVQEGLRTIMVFPIVHEGGALGAINLASRRLDQFPREVGESFASISSQVACAFGRFRLEEKLRQSEDRYRRLFEAGRDAVFVLDSSYRIVMVNHVVEQIAEVSRDRLLGVSLFALFQGFKQTPFFRVYRDVMKSRVPATVSGVFAWPDQSSRWYEDDVYPFGDGLLCVSRDVTERIRMEQLAKESEENFRMMAECTRDGVVVLSAAGVPLYANERAGVLLGCSKDEVLGMPVDRWLHARQRGEIAAQIAKMELRAPFTYHHEAMLHPRSGDSFPVEIVMSRTHWGHAAALLIQIRDISWRKRLQAQVLNAVTWEKQNLARALHDGVAQQIAATAFLCKTVETSLSAQGGREAGMVVKMEALLQESKDQLRNLARVLLPNLTVLNLEESLGRLVENTETLFGVSCVLIRKTGLNGATGPQTEQIYYIAQEAIMNAIRHGCPRHITVSVMVNGNGGMRMEIADDGCGFSSEVVRPDAFGLHIMQYRAESLGGWLTIDSKKGAGTMVVCEVPFCVDESHTKQARVGAHAPGRKKHVGTTIVG
jgi:PAS domain S-box-containing protein